MQEHQQLIILIVIQTEQKFNIDIQQMVVRGQSLVHLLLHVLEFQQHSQVVLPRILRLQQ